MHSCKRDDSNIMADKLEDNLRATTTVSRQQQQQQQQKDHHHHQKDVRHKVIYKIVLTGGTFHYTF